MGGEGDGDGLAVPEGDVDVEAVVEEGLFFADLVVVDEELVAGLGVHEDVGVGLGVDVLELAVLDVRGLELFTGLEGALEDRAGDEVPDLDAGEGLALAGLHELEIDDGVGGAVEHHLDVLADVGSIHGITRGKCAVRGLAPRGKGGQGYHRVVPPSTVVG